MQPQVLENLSERLLRAGVAYRHVRRYVRELHDHYEDALRQEISKGLNHSLAEQAAWARLGNEEELARSVLAQPALRSTAARFPVLVFGAAPVFIWFGLLVLAFFAPLAVLDVYDPLPMPNWLLRSTYAVWLLSVRVLPVILGVVVLIASARQRMTLYWPIIGTAIVALISGTTTVHLRLSAAPEASDLGISSALLPMIFPTWAELGKPNAAALAGGVVRAVLMLGIAVTPYVIWRIRQSRSSMAT